MLEELKVRVCSANLELQKRGLVIYTWGNVSGIDRKSGLVVIKPSGLPYDSMKPEDMSVVELSSGKTLEGKFKPSSDTPTHLALYRRFEDIAGITHTHSVNAAAFAQAGMAIPALGTTHADYFRHDIPCTRELREDEVFSDYELNTGRVIIESLEKLGFDPMAVPGILVKNHGPFTWGTSPENSVYNSVVLETLAEMALKTLFLNPESSMPDYILQKHYSRKHGPNAYYGQK